MVARCASRTGKESDIEVPPLLLAYQYARFDATKKRRAALAHFHVAHPLSYPRHSLSWRHGWRVVRNFVSVGPLLRAASLTPSYWAVLSHIRTQKSRLGPGVGAPPFRALFRRRMAAVLTPS